MSVSSWFSVFFAGALALWVMALLVTEWLHDRKWRRMERLMTLRMELKDNAPFVEAVAKAAKKRVL